MWRVLNRSYRKIRLRRRHCLTLSVPLTSDADILSCLKKRFCLLSGRFECISTSASAWNSSDVNIANTIMWRELYRRCEITKYWQLVSSRDVTVDVANFTCCFVILKNASCHVTLDIIDDSYADITARLFCIFVFFKILFCLWIWKSHAFVSWNWAITPSEFLLSREWFSFFVCGGDSCCFKNSIVGFVW